MEIKEELYKTGKPYYVQYVDPQTGKLCRFDLNEISSSRWTDRYNSWVSETRPIVKFIKKIDTHAFTKMYKFENGVVFLIDKFTKKKYNEEDLADFRLKVLKQLSGVVTNICFKEGGRLWIETETQIIKARKLTEVIKGIDEVIPDIETDTRNGKCHAYALELMMALSTESVVVTGICYTLSPRGKFLHSWVEATNDDGQIFCFDATLNIMMRQEDFYNIWHVRPCATLTKEQFMADLPKLALGRGLCDKQYLMNREEVLKMADNLKQENPEER